MRITIGADPEFFLENSKGQPVPAVGLVPGTKDKPFPLKKGAIQLDGTAVEFNLKPALTKEGFCLNLRSVLKEVRTMIPEEYKFKFEPSVFYDKATFDKLPETAKELGCTPDIDAYSGSYNPTPQPTGSYERMRTGAGHLHIGWGSGFDVDSRSHRWDCFEVVKALDGVFQCYEKLWDTSGAGLERRRLYGKLGACRVKSYGVEYRPLSNAWVGKPKLWGWLHDVTKFVTSQVAEGKHVVYANGDPFYNTAHGRSNFTPTMVNNMNHEFTRRMKGFPEFSTTMLE